MLRTIVFGCSVMLMACGGKQEPREPAQGVIPKTHLDALDKAEQVESMLKQADEKRRSQENF